MRGVLIVLVVLAAAPAWAADPPEVLRARAALALAFARPAKVAGYPEGYDRAMKEGKPLVVFVGQPARELPGCVVVREEAFPGIAGEAVLVGLPDGRGLRRHDLPGRPGDATIRAVIGAANLPPG